MGRHYLPRQDNAFSAGVGNFATRIGRQPDLYGLTEADAAAYAAAERAFAAAYGVATRPETRTKSAVSGKDEARRRLEAETRRLVPIVRATLGPGAAEELADLGLPSSTMRCSAVRVPAEAPDVGVDALPGGRLRIKLGIAGRQDGGSGRPRDAIGAIYFVHAGEAALPTERWPIAEMSTKTEAIVLPDRELLLPMRTPRVWATACWLGPRLDRGPLARPVELAVARPEAALPDQVRLAA